MRACTEHAKQQTITCQETWPSNKQTRPRALLEYEIPPILGGIPALKLLPRGPCPSPDLRLHHAPPAPSRALLESPKEGGVALAVRARGGAYEHSAPSDDSDECVVLAGRGGDAAAPPMVHVVACVRYNGNVGGRRREATHVLLDSFFFKHRRACPVCTVLNACFGLSLRGARRAAAAAYKIASAWRAGVRARACAYTEYSKEFIITYPVEILSVPLCHFSKLRENVPKR